MDRRLKAFSGRKGRRDAKFMDLIVPSVKKALTDDVSSPTIPLITVSVCV